MAAPTPTARQLPSGYRPPEGFKSLIAFASKPALQIWEMAVTPPTIDNGEPLPYTTQHNVAVRTFRPRKLKTIGPVVRVTCMYDPDVWADLYSMNGVEDTITKLYPDGTTLCFYGYLKSSAGGEEQEGSPVNMTLEIVITNWDHTANVEAVPVLTQASGT